ncbi:MAG: hypothetical protein ACI4TD_04280 [Phocaeicola sp.]
MAYVFEDLLEDIKKIRNKVTNIEGVRLDELAEDAFNALEDYRYDQLKENEQLDGKLYMAELAIIAAVAIKGDIRND